jgi:hypothetical protein
MWNDLFVPGGEDFVWLRRELPWLDTGFLPRLPSGQLGRTLEDLDRLGFKVYHLEGERIRSAEECYAEVTRTFGFWDNWEGKCGCVSRLLHRCGVPAARRDRLELDSSVGNRRPSHVRAHGRPLDTGAG